MRPWACGSAAVEAFNCEGTTDRTTVTQARPLRRFWYPAVALLDALGACSHAAPTPSAGPPQPPPPAVSTVAAIDPYHPPARDTVDVAAYKGWQQYSLQCARCHGEDAQGTSFAPSLVVALKPAGHASSPEEFTRILTEGRPDKGMPSASKMGLDSAYFDGLYQYLKGRSDGRLHGGRPARRES
jgi:mono/diheme cytochrome c family protein